MSSIYANLSNDKQYRAASGLSKSNFEKLLSVFEKYYVPKLDYVYSEEKKPVLTDQGEALFFILHYFKSYPTLQNMGLYFGFSEYTVSSYLERIKPALKQALSELSELKTAVFKNQAAFDAAFEGVSEIYIDVSEVPTERPQNEQVQAQYYSGKKNNTP